MLAVLDLITGELAPTATYAKRSFVFTPVDPEYPEPDGRLGNLTLKLQAAKGGTGRKIDLDTYAIEESDNHNAAPGNRVFWFINLTDKAQVEPYETTVGPNHKCTCKAGKCKVESGCKHVAAMTALIEEGAV